MNRAATADENARCIETLGMENSRIGYSYLKNTVRSNDLDLFSGGKFTSNCTGFTTILLRYFNNIDLYIITYKL